MITLERPAFYENDRYAEYCGLSGDDKATIDAKNGDEFYEIDTGKVYKYNAENNVWAEQPKSGGGGGTGDVSSVNGKTGAVTLTADDVGALPDTTIIPDTDDFMTKSDPTGTGSFSLNRKSITNVGTNSFAAGSGTTASGASSCAIGGDTTASGMLSYAEGRSTTAQRRSQHVQGEYNISDTVGTTTSRGKYTHIVGNGTSSSKRSNAHTLDWSGNAWYAGDVYVGSTSGTNKDSGSKKLITNELDSNLYLNGNAIMGVKSISDADSGLAIESELSMNNHKITDVENPTASQDVATKVYVDSKVAAVLPPITEEANGKVLGVVDGALAWVDKV